MGVCIKYAGAQHHLGEIVLFRGLPSIVILTLFATLQGQALFGQHLGLHARRNLSGSTAMWMGFYAIGHLPLGVATTLNYTSPLFMAAMLLWATRETLVWRQEWGRLAAVVVGFFGVLWIYNPFQANQLSLVALLCGLGGGALGALAYMNVRLLGQAGEPEWRTVLLFSMTTSLTGLVSIMFWGFSEHYTARSVAALIGIGVFGMLAQLSMTRAFGRGQATLSATLQYSTIVFAALWGELLWQEHIGPSGFAGMAMVIAAGMLASYLGLRLPAKPTPEPPAP